MRTIVDKGLAVAHEIHTSDVRLAPEKRYRRVKSGMRGCARTS